MLCDNLEGWDGVGGRREVQGGGGGCVCVCVCVLVPQSCPTLCYPMDCSPPGSSVHGIL